MAEIDIYDIEAVREYTKNMDPDEKKKYMKKINNQKYFQKHKTEINSKYKEQRLAWWREKYHSDEEFKLRNAENSKKYYDRKTAIYNMYKWAHPIV